MKRVSVLLLAVFLSLPAFAQETDEAPERHRIRIDRNHSTLGFNVPIVHGLSRVTGKFTDFSVELFWDENDLEHSSVHLEIDVASVDTGIDRRNGHLRSEDFFDVETYPTITFVSSEIMKNGADFLVKGTLTMHGVSNEIYLPLSTKSFEDGPGNSAWTSFSVHYTLDRTHYGMDWKQSAVSFFIGNDIEMDIVLLTR